LSDEAGPGRSTLQIVLLVLGLLLAGLFASRGQWLLAVVLLVCSGAPVAALGRDRS
jgi:hypothetical protein